MLTLPNLLIVDDDILILECFRYAFAEQSFSLTTATTAKEAIELFRKGSFDAVITDIRLPDSTGLKLLQDLHAVDPKIPIILMTGQRLGGLVAHERLGRSDLRTARREMIGHQYAHEEQESETNDHHQFVFARHD